MGDDAERREALRALLEADGDIPSLVQGLDPFRSVDVEPVISMTAQHVISVLERFLAGELSCEDVGLWAEALEWREDVEESEEGPEVMTFVLELATEGWSRPVTPERARQFVEELTV